MLPKFPAGGAPARPSNRSRVRPLRWALIRPGARGRITRGSGRERDEAGVAGGSHAGRRKLECRPNVGSARSGSTNTFIHPFCTGRNRPVRAATPDRTVRRVRARQHSARAPSAVPGRRRRKCSPSASFPRAPACRAPQHGARGVAGDDLPGWRARRRRRGPRSRCGTTATRPRVHVPRLEDAVVHGSPDQRPEPEESARARRRAARAGAPFPDDADARRRGAVRQRAPRSLRGVSRRRRAQALARRATTLPTTTSSSSGAAAASPRVPSATPARGAEAAGAMAHRRRRAARPIHRRRAPHWQRRRCPGRRPAGVRAGPKQRAGLLRGDRGDLPEHAPRRSRFANESDATPEREPQRLGVRSSDATAETSKPRQRFGGFCSAELAPSTPAAHITRTFPPSPVRRAAAAAAGTSGPASASAFPPARAFFANISFFFTKSVLNSARRLAACPARPPRRGSLRPSSASRSKRSSSNCSPSRRTERCARLLAARNWPYTCRARGEERKHAHGEARAASARAGRARHARRPPPPARCSRRPPRRAPPRTSRGTERRRARDRARVASRHAARCREVRRAAARADRERARRPGDRYHALHPGAHRGRRRARRARTGRPPRDVRGHAPGSATPVVGVRSGPPSRR